MEPPVSAEAVAVEQLIAEVRRGAKAFEQLVQGAQGKLLRLAEKNLPIQLQPKVGASSLVQEALVKAWRAFPEFRGSTEAELLAWLREILRNTLAKEKRKYRTRKRDIQREQPIGPENSASAPENHPVAPEPSPCSQLMRQEQQLQDQQRQDALLVAVAGLPEDQRLALLLHRKHSLSDAAIGELLNLSAHAVCQLRYRAMVRLKRALTTQADE